MPFNILFGTRYRPSDSLQVSRPSSELTMLPALEVSLDPHLAFPALLLPARSGSCSVARQLPPPRGWFDAPLLGFLAPSAAFGLLRPQAYCSLMSDVRFTSFLSVRSPTDVIRPKSNQTLAGTRRGFPAVRYTLRRLAPRRQQKRLTTPLAFLPFTANGAALTPSAEADVPVLPPKGNASDMSALARCSVTDIAASVLHPLPNVCTLTTRRNTKSLRPTRAFPPSRNLFTAPLHSLLLPAASACHGFLRPSCVPAIGASPHLVQWGGELMPPLEVAFVETDMMHDLGSSILWQRPKPSRTHDIAMSPKRGTCTPHTICRALEPPIARLSTHSVTLQTPTVLPLPCGSFLLAKGCQRRRRSVARPPVSLEPAAPAVGPLPAICTRGAAWDDRSLDSHLARRLHSEDCSARVLLSMVLHPVPARCL
jgi:hypothetical protein